MKDEMVERVEEYVPLGESCFLHGEMCEIGYELFVKWKYWERGPISLS
jgi:hypothetical protein